MSPIGQARHRRSERLLIPAPEGLGCPVAVWTYDMARGQRFGWHEHPHHQLAWATSGTLTVDTPGGAWFLPSSRALWIPAGTVHAPTARDEAVMRSLYFPPDRCPVAWTEPTVVGVDPLLARLIDHLAQPELGADERRHCEAVVLDLLQPIPSPAIQLLLPVDERARQVADALVSLPSDGRSLEAWGRAVGASSRTLARLFAAETGLSFGTWRTRLRVLAAIALLADGSSVTSVAHQVGYATPSAFVAAFRRVAGTTPGTYAQGARP